MLNNNNYRIALSFFPLLVQDFEFTVFRRMCTNEDWNADSVEVKQRRLPLHPTDPINGLSDAPEYGNFWVSYERREGFVPFICRSRTNNYLTLDYLEYLLRQRCLSLPTTEYRIEDRLGGSRVLFVLRTYPEGHEIVWLQAFFLKAANEFGFLADYKFDAPSYITQSKRVLELSLTHKNGRANRDYYADRFDKLQEFVSRYHSRIFPLHSNSRFIPVSKSLREIGADVLRPKTYVFANDRTSNSQFLGVKSNGPLHPPTPDVRVYFLFRPQDRPLADDLFRALRGDTFETFAGMEAMFRFKWDGSTVGGTAVNGFDVDELNRVSEYMRADAGDKFIVPLLVTPFNKEGGPDESRAYYLAKHTLLSQGWPSQFVSLKTLRDRNTLKWSVSNIGLQLFAKMGGQPWKVQPQTRRCLIVGLGQAHRVSSEKIQKYFAYSVLTDSSGLYKDLRVLGQSEIEDNYLVELKQNVRKVFEDYQEDYHHFVVHATFSIRKSEIDALEEVITDLSSDPNRRLDFVVMKFNDRNRYFGYSVASNSLVPYESSFLALSYSDYLIWFEGLQRHNPNITKRIERPLHLAFLYPLDLDRREMRDYLQDALNLSGANWRGFNSKSLPVSVYYAKLIADYYKEFEALGLPEIDLSAIHPWFL